MNPIIHHVLVIVSQILYTTPKIFIRFHFKVAYRQSIVIKKIKWKIQIWKNFFGISILFWLRSLFQLHLFFCLCEEVSCEHRDWYFTQDCKCVRRFCTLSFCQLLSLLEDYWCSIVRVYTKAFGWMIKIIRFILMRNLAPILLDVLDYSNSQNDK